MIKQLTVLRRKIPIFGLMILIIALLCFLISFCKSATPRLPEIADTPLIESKPRNLEIAGARLIDSKPETEVRHIAFLKVHKAASTTLQTMFFRFGYRRNLTFVLPAKGHYFSKSSNQYEPLLPRLLSDQYDILCNHGYFNYSIYSSLLPKDTVYIAVVREPWTQFVSAFNYYSSMYHFEYLEKIPGNKLENLIKHPQIYDEAPLSYTMNSMAKDFGFTLKHYDEITSGKKTNVTHGYLNSLGEVFDFVLIKEHLDESIILMRRILGWSLKDVLYISKNVISPELQINNELMAEFKVRNKLDYLVYDYFNEKFQAELSKHGDDLIEETINYKKVLVKVQNWCFDHFFGEFVIEATRWNEQFTITSLDCQLMTKEEIEFIYLLKGKAVNL